MDNKQPLVVDTNVLVSFLRGRDASLTSLSKGNTIVVSSITVFELAYGALKSSRPKQLAMLENFLGSFRVISFGSREAQKAARIRHALEKKGAALDLRDIFIAAGCMTSGYRLATQNMRHFSRINGLKLHKVTGSV